MITVLDTHFLATPQSIAVFAVADDDGYTLVETGPYSTHAAVMAELRRAAIDPERVHSVLLTHIHFDHAGAAWWWAQRGATIYVHPAGYRHMHDPERLYDSARQIYGRRMDELWGEMRSIDEEHLERVEDGVTLQLGGRQWRALHTPGHAKHHIAWQLDDVVFTGDVGGCAVAGGLVVPPCPPPDIDREAWLASIDRLRQTQANAFYLTHYGSVANTAAHLAELGERLNAYIDWMQPFYTRNTPPNEIEPLFKTFVVDELRAAGVTDDRQLAAYLAANPPGMSVAGILRYLSKRDMP